MGELQFIGLKPDKPKFEIHTYMKEPLPFRLVPIRMFTVEAIIDRPQTIAKQQTCDQWSPLQTNFGRDIVFSADLCYNGANEKPSSERKVAREA